LRKGGRRTLSATLGTAADASAQRAAGDESADKGRLGLAVRPLSPQEQEAANVSGGLLVQGVNGPAARAGVAPGDIVLQAGGRPVKSVEDLRAATRSGKTIALLVQRGAQRLFVPLQAG
jgi:serine protease Do